jgi:iron complex outermembrane receptor protein
MRSIRLRAAMAASSILTCAFPAYAQTASTDGTDIIVTARRIEERLQDVPISITVFNQQQLSNRNVISSEDLAKYTPSLSTNNYFGSDNTSFAIRGFVQDVGTAPSVGTYFADVVAPRGATNGQTVGDGANAGDFFDLQNVQVLKGPQGTLFGRNTTGGSVLFVPQKPVDKFEGYVQAGAGNYGMQHFQGVINIPLSDTFLIRAGFDHMKRDGYLNNVSGIGPRHYDDVDYWAARLSVVAQITPTLENYMIASFNSSQNAGSINKLVAANPSQGVLVPIPDLPTFGSLAAAQLAEQGKGFYNVEGATADAHVHTGQWQLINTTTWTASDALTVKNIISYAQLKQEGLNPIFGILYRVPVAGQVYNTAFEMSNSPINGATANESTFTEEFRLQGSLGGDRLTWQSGAYFELASPLGFAGSQSPGFSSCANNLYHQLNCTDPLDGLFSGALGLPPGSVNVANLNETLSETTYHDVGLYAQATYKLAEKLKLTGGFRYTWDREHVDSIQRVYSVPAAPTYALITDDSYKCFHSVIATLPNCAAQFSTKSSAPTWLIDLDFTPTRDLLFYAKYARGYRAAVIVPVIPVGGTAADPDFTFNYPKPERVDSFEVGAKTSFSGAIRGSFDIAGFYNKFNNQQIQVAFLPIDPSQFPQTAAPVNAGKSTIYGAEIEATLTPFTGLDLTLGYTYLHTRIDEVLTPPSNPDYTTLASFSVGDPEPFSPRNKLTAGATYHLPLRESVGRLSVGATFTYRSGILTNYDDRSNPDPVLAQYSYLPSLSLVDANANWTNVASLPIDLAFFVTNLTKKKYYTNTPGLGNPGLGQEAAIVGEPRMYGFTAKYHF